MLPKDELPGPVEAAQPLMPPATDDDATQDSIPMTNLSIPMSKIWATIDTRSRATPSTIASATCRRLLTQIRAIPNIQNGKTNGFSLSEIEPGSVFDEMGFEEGDVLRSINGQPMTDPAHGDADDELRCATQVRLRVQVLRDGHPTTLTYQIQ